MRREPHFLAYRILCVILVVVLGFSGAIAIHIGVDADSALDLGARLTSTPSGAPHPHATPVSSSKQPPVNLAQVLEQELQRNYNGKPAALAHAAYCKCPKSVASSKNLCNNISSQCRSSFCMPICTRMAWQPRIEVHCDRAPSWHWCPLFAKQVAEAETAVTAQFQAHTCLQMGFCNRTEEFIDWVENHTFGHSYPNHRLPIQACKPAPPEKPKLKSSSSSQSEREGKQKSTAELAREAIKRAAETALKQNPLPSNAEQRRKPNSKASKSQILSAELDEAERNRIQASLCGACQSVLDVSIVRGTCIPGGSAKNDATLMQEGSLHDRCLFVADTIGSRATHLLTEFKQSVCNCLGCCGTGTCYFPNVEKQWLNSLIENVQQKIQKELNVEGWRDEL